jgi:uncharacterized membrane protein YfcA
VLARFGVVSLGGALIGSLLYGTVGNDPIRIILAIFLIASGMMEFIPKGHSLHIPRRFDYVGGFASGLLGGLIGNQGAIRSAYLLNYNLSKEAFVATATSIAIIIDATRIPMYIVHHASQWSEITSTLVLVAAVAWGGTYLGKHVLATISLKHFRMIVAGFLMVMGVVLLL